MVHFRPRQLLILPGLKVRSEADLLPRLATPTVQRGVRIITEAHAAGVTMASSCAGSFVLAQAGLLSGKPGTTAWWLALALRRMHPDVILKDDQLVVATWPVVTAGAALAQMNLMLTIVAKFPSPGLSHACARYLLMDMRSSQVLYIAVSLLARRDEHISRAET